MFEIIKLIAIAYIAYSYLQQKQQIEDMQDKIETLEDTVIMQEKNIGKMGEIIVKGLIKNGNDGRTENDSKIVEECKEHTAID
jgi:TolA-binding protein